MAFAVKASAQNSGSGTTPTVTIDCTGANYLFGFCYSLNIQANTFTFNAVSCSEIIGRTADLGMKMTLQGLKVPSQGSYALQGSIASSQQWAMHAYAFSGIKQTYTETGSVSADADEQSSWSPSGVSSAVGELLITSCCLQDGSPSAWAISGGTISGSWDTVDDTQWNATAQRLLTSFATSNATSNGCTWSGVGGQDYCGAFVSMPIFVAGVGPIWVGSKIREMKEFFGNLKSGRIPPDQLMQDYQKLIGGRDALAVA